MIDVDETYKNPMSKRAEKTTKVRKRKEKKMEVRGRHKLSADVNFTAANYF